MEVGGRRLGGADMNRAFLLLVAVLAPDVARADDGTRPYCPARPGLATPACTIAPGRVSVETSLADWTLNKDGADRSDTVLIGATSVRLGLTDAIEAQIGWTPLGIVRDRVGGSVDRRTRSGDVTLGAKANVANPDGSGLSLAFQPFVTLPLGRAPVGAGDWGAGMIVPVTYGLAHNVNLEFTPEIDAAPNQAGAGRHFAISGVVGVGFAATDKLTVTVEGKAVRDDDPSGKSTSERASLSVAWMVHENLQLDVGAVSRINHNAPDAEFYFGIARRF